VLGHANKTNWTVNLLDKLLSLDVGHAVHTGDTITMVVQSASQSHCHLAPSRYSSDTRSWQRQACRRALCCRVSPSIPRVVTYPTDRTRPVSAMFDSSWTPRILCSRIDETSVGEAFASAYVRVWRAETAGAAFRCRRPVSLAEKRDGRQKRHQTRAAPVQAPDARPMPMRRGKRAQLSFRVACRVD
jgi:hypothetical protein